MRRPTLALICGWAALAALFMGVVAVQAQQVSYPDPSAFPDNPYVNRAASWVVDIIMPASYPPAARLT